jgi:hypothetical protein
MLNLLAVFETKRERDFQRKQAESQKAVVSSLAKLRRHAATTLADEIARIAGSEIKDLMALLPAISNNPIGCDPFSEVGHWIASAIYGGLPDCPVRPTPADAGRYCLTP